MTKISVPRLLAVVLLSGLPAFSIWVPGTPENDQQAQTSSPPGSELSRYDWVEFPDVMLAVEPLRAQQAPPSLKAAGAPTRVESVPDGEARPAAVTFQPVNDVTTSLEWGYLRLKNISGTRGSYDDARGFTLTAKARYSRSPKDSYSFGAILYNEWARLTHKSNYMSPSSDALTLGAFYKHFLGEHHQVGGQVGFSLLFGNSGTYVAATRTYTFESTTGIALNPLAFYIFKTYFGPFLFWGGAWLGYSYTSLSVVESQFSYAGITGGGIPIGQSLAANYDLALSHRFLIVGLQIPLYVSSKFSFTPGIKLPFLFGEQSSFDPESKIGDLWNPRLTIGVSSRF